MLLKNSIIVTAISILISVLGFFVQIMVAQNFGAGIELDAYLYSISLPIFLSSMIASLLSYVIIPKIASNNDKNEEQSKFVVSVLMASIIISLLMMVTSPGLIWIQKSLMPSHSVMASKSNIKNLLFLGWCIGASQIILSSATAILNGLKKPIYSANLNFGPYIGMMLFLSVKKDNNIEYLAIGLLTGTIASIFFAIHPLRKMILNYWKKIEWNQIKTEIIKAPYTIIGMSCFSAYAVIDSYWGGYAGEGVLSILGYSQRIMIATGNLAISGPSAVIGARFAELINEKNNKKFKETLVKVLLSTVGILLILIAIIYLFSESIVKIIFVRGSFNENHALQVAEVLKYCMPGMLCMLLSSICLRVLFCLKNIERGTFLFGAMWSILYFNLSGILIDHSAKGIAIAYSISWVLSFSYLYLLLKNKIKKNFDLETK